MFCVLDGFCLTVHHVVFGLHKIQVRLPGQAACIEGKYVAELSNPAADIAVINLPPGSLPPIQVAHTRAGPRVEVYGYGYRPSTLANEPHGHTFSGRLGPGQTLQIPVSPAALKRVAVIPPAERGAWNDFPAPFRTEQCRNLESASGLEQGISGGPVYDPGLRKVTGIFRAVEGDARAYVIPLDTVFARWPQLLTNNAQTVVDDALGKLQSDFELKLVAEGALPRTPVLRRRFDELFRAYAHFGGRARELAALNAFAADPARRYFFVTGFAGYGKSALLANWVSTFKPPPAVAYHFLSKKVDNSVDSAFCFSNLCEQMMAVHGLGGDLPDAFRLPDLYQQLLRLPPPPGQRLLVLIDGLDEALGRWTPGPSMFPPGLPDGVQLVFSAREIADRDWPLSLKLKLDAASVLRLGKLDRPAIDDVLANLKLAAPLADRLWELSQGDAFYLQDLLADLEAANSIDPAQLAAYPIGHNEYLKLWWQDAEVDHKGFKDFMGLLAVARDSLTKAQLAAISPTDELDEWNIDAAAAKAARYVIGDEARGYRLSHTRIQEFIEAKLGKGIIVYRNRFVEYCQGWATAALDAPSRRYVLSYGARHMADADAYEPLLKLLDGEWIAATWRDLGTYAELIDDCSIAAGLALRRTDLPRIAAAAVMRATARTVMASFHASVLAAMARLGGAQRVIEMLRAERGILMEQRTPEALIGVGVELLRVASPPGNGPDEITEFLGALIQRAFEGGPVLFLFQFATAIARALDAGPGLDEQRTSGFLEQMQRAMKAHPGDPARDSAVFGVMAQSAARLPAANLLAQSLLADADRIAEVLGNLDRFGALAATLPAKARMEHLDPAEVVRSLLSGVDNWFAGLLFDNAPLLVLLHAMPWEATTDRPGAVRLLLEIASKAQSSQHFSPPWVTSVMRAMWRLAAFDEVTAFNNNLAAVSAPVAAAAIAASAREIRAVAPQEAVEWLEWAAPNAPPAEMARAWCAVGEWERAIAALGAVPAKLPPERESFAALIQGMIGIVAAAPPAPDAAPGVVQRLLEMGSIQPRSRAEQLAAAARALAGTVPVVARSYLDRAVALQVSRFPPGDLGHARRFLALAFAQDGQMKPALDAVRKIPAAETQIETFGDLISSTPAGQRAALDAYCAFVGEFCAGDRVGNAFAPLRAGLALLPTLRERCPDAAATLQAYLQTKGRLTLQSLAGVFEGFAHQPRNLWTMGWQQFADLADLAGRLAAVLPAEAQDVLARLENAAAAQPPPGAMRVMLVYHRSLPDGTETVAKVRQSVAECLQHDKTAPPAEDWLQLAPVLIGPAIGRLSRAGIDDSAAYLRSLLEVVLRIRAPLRLRSAMQAYWDALAQCDPSLLHRHPGVARDAMAAIHETLGPGRLRTGVIERVLNVLVEVGEVEAAHTFAKGLKLPEERNFALETLQSAEKTAALGALTLLERAFVARGRNNPFGMLVLQKLRSGEGPQETVNAFARSLANDQVLSTRLGVLDANFWPLLLPVYQQSGSAAVGAMIDAIEEFDGRFRQAATSLSTKALQGGECERR